MKTSRIILSLVVLIIVGVLGYAYFTSTESSSTTVVATTTNTTSTVPVYKFNVQVTQQVEQKNISSNQAIQFNAKILENYTQNGSMINQIITINCPSSLVVCTTIKVGMPYIMQLSLDSKMNLYTVQNAMLWGGEQ